MRNRALPDRQWPGSLLLIVLLGVRAQVASGGEPALVPLFDHYQAVSGVGHIPAELSHRSAPLDFLFLELDVTGDGLPELFLSCTVTSGKWGMVFEIYSPESADQPVYRWLNHNVVLYLENERRFSFDRSSQVLYTLTGCRQFKEDGSITGRERNAKGDPAHPDWDPGLRPEPPSDPAQLEYDFEVLAIPLGSLRAALEEVDSTGVLSARDYRTKEAASFDLSKLRGKLTVDGDGRFPLPDRE